MSYEKKKRFASQSEKVSDKKKQQWDCCPFLYCTVKVKYILKSILEAEYEKLDRKKPNSTEESRAKIQNSIPSDVLTTRVCHCAARRRNWTNVSRIYDDTSCATKTWQMPLFTLPSCTDYPPHHSHAAVIKTLSAFITSDCNVL